MEIIVGAVLSIVVPWSEQKNVVMLLSAIMLQKQDLRGRKLKNDLFSLALCRVLSWQINSLHSFYFLAFILICSVVSILLFMFN